MLIRVVDGAVSLAVGLEALGLPGVGRLCVRSLVRISEVCLLVLLDDGDVDGRVQGGLGFLAWLV